MRSSLPCDAPPCQAVPDERLRLIVASYRRLTGKELLDEIPGNDEALRLALWNAPRAIVAHGTEADPVFFYGNRLALELFEMDFDSFAQLPSQLSAEPLAQGARERLLEKVMRQGYVDGYSGMRIAASGRRFMIADCTVWNLQDGAGVLHGQAAVFIPQQ
ncbi:MAG TPA: MEKHLA domain-containing protein [Gallionella sp.]|nr:MEKHLA domain-containing protein [Gallionella sp.]